MGCAEGDAVAIDSPCFVPTSYAKYPTPTEAATAIAVKTRVRFMVHSFRLPDRCSAGEPRHARPPARDPGWRRARRLPRGALPIRQREFADRCRTRPSAPRLAGEQWAGARLRAAADARAAPPTPSASCGI